MTRYFRVGILGFLLSGCASQGPANQYFPMAYQKEMFSASHWKLLAAQTATELRQDLPSGPTAVWLQQDDNSLFSTGFGDFLADELVHRGVAVSLDHGDRIIKVKIEVVHHRSGPPADPLKFTFLGTVSGLGVWAGVSAPLTMASSAIPPVGVVAGAVIDAKRDLMPPATSTEVIISTKIFNEGYQIGGKSDVFYIQTSNSEEYARPLIRPIPVVGF